ncbi:MAG: hypothetical protein KatS3mg058_1177 [Roseiflexus sp.]|nr:MAG: hypothetical protein KatS3mg058_1177 [Roseiflexus sp.]
MGKRFENRLATPQGARDTLLMLRRWCRRRDDVLDQTISAAIATADLQYGHFRQAILHVTASIASEPTTSRA